MIERCLDHIAKMVDGEFSDSKYSHIKIKGVSIDSRTIKKDSLYIPIVGEKFDGRIFIEECQNAGAPAFLIDKNYKIPKSINIPYIKVEDTQKALRNLARAYRQELDIRIIAITGSKGKTTSKNIIHSVLSEKYKVDPRRSASLMDIFSAVMQGFIPYGAQVLMAVSYAGGKINVFSIMPYLWYQFALLFFAILSIFIPYANSYINNYPWDFEKWDIQ